MNKGHILILLMLILLTELAFIRHTVRADTCIGGGALSITAIPSGSPLPNTDVSITDQVVSTTFPSSIYFEDMRGTTDGFSITITSTDFQDTQNINNTFALTNFAIKSDNNDTVGLVDCDGSTGITLNAGAYSNFIDDDVNGLSNAKSLVTGDSTVRVGKYSIEPQIQLTTPARTPAGTFRTTLTISIQ